MRSLAGKNVLITGGLGFIGSNLAIRLLSDGARVAVCDAMIEGYGGNFANVREVVHDLDIHISDVRDEEEMAGLVEGRDVVFHLAAQVSHVLSLSDPYPDIDINIKGTERLRQYGWSRRDYSEVEGRNSRMDELQAAVLRAKLPLLEADNGRRREIAERYDDAFSRLPLAMLRRRPGSLPAPHLYPVRTPARDELARHLSSRGVETAIHYPVPLHFQQRGTSTEGLRIPSSFSGANRRRTARLHETGTIRRPRA